LWDEAMLGDRVCFPMVLHIGEELMKRSFLALFLTLVSSASFANSGPFTTKVAFTTDRDGNAEIYTMNPNGSGVIRLTNNTDTDTHPVFSLDGKKIAFTSARDGNNEIYVMNADGTGQTRLTDNPASDIRPTWSPDGQRIVFESNRSGNSDLFLIFSDGSGSALPLTNDPGSDTDPSFSPKGDKIAFLSNRDGGNTEVYTMSAGGLNQTRFTNNDVLEVHPRISRNGNRITFARHVFDNITGFNLQVVVTNLSGANSAVLTSAGANSNPEFSADGNRIFFNSNRDGGLPELYSMAVDGSNQVRLTNNVFNDLAPSSQGVFEVETMAVYRPTLGKWLLSLANESSPLSLIVALGGQPGDLPVTGNWDGDTRTDIGVFRNGTFHLGVLKPGIHGTFVEELAPIPFGQPGDLPLAGDWDGDGKDDVGVFRPGVIGKFILRQPARISAPFNTTIITAITFNFGTAGDLPVTGDWDGDGDETPGVYRQGDPGAFLLTNSFTSVIDFNFSFGSFDVLPLSGDWLGAGRDGVGVFLPGSQLMILTQELSSKGAFIFTFGQPGDLPVAGSWLP
jgi:Tol biopolymer transport system component